MTALVLALTVFLAVLPLTACKKDNNSREVKFLEENIIDDKYDNYYEIFVYSFCDSDGDGIGDLNGVAQKMDYIRDMGYTGIWLMPINPCASYHGYDVTDYYGINPKYGTLEDYQNLLSVAHEKGVKVIMDLVINHTSSQHPWFKDELAKKNNGAAISAANDFYNWSRTQKDNYSKSGNVWYEAQFDSGMPDLNLSSEKLRAEIEKILKHWLEMGTDGFRLDGCYYYGAGNAASGEFCQYVHDTALKYNENVYIVGECWGPSRTVMKNSYYASGVESFFDFDVTNEVVGSINTASGDDFFNSMRQCAKTVSGIEGAIAAPFLSNHDNGKGRIAGRMSRDPVKIQFAYGLLSLYSGNTFTYYGDEIGMFAKNPNSDPDLRVGILWNDASSLTTPPPGANTDTDYAFGSVEAQLADSNSIINYYKMCNNARNAFPALMRGEATRVFLDEYNPAVLVFKKTYKEQTITIAVNLSENENRADGVEGTLAQSICVSGKIGREGTSLNMPGYSIAILT